MNANRIAVTAAVLALLTATAQAAKVDILPLVNLSASQVFQWRQVDILDPSRFTDNTVKGVVSVEPGNAGRLRLDVYETSPELPDFHFGSLIFAKGSTGVTFYGSQFGATAEDLRDYASYCDAGVLWPRYMTPDQETHVTAIWKNGAGVQWWDNGATRALYAGEVGLYRGLYFLSIETDYGMSCSLILKPGKGVVGCEFGWISFIAENL